MSATSTLWTLNRAGTRGGTSDIWDNATDFINAVNASAGRTGSPLFAAPGQPYRLRICNQTNSSETIAKAPTDISVVVNGTYTVAQGSCGIFVTTVLSLSPAQILIVAG